MRIASLFAIILCALLINPLRIASQEKNPSPLALNYLAKFDDNFVIFHMKEPMFNTNWTRFSQSDHPRPIHFRKQGFFDRLSDISIVTDRGFFGKSKEEKREVLLSYLKNNYSPDVIDVLLGVRFGCVAYRFKSRDTWSGYSVIIADTEILKEDSITDECIYTALDYFSGLPILYKDTYINNEKQEIIDIVVSRVPQEQTRRLILDAIYACAAEGFTESLAPEKTRSGLTSHPSKRCIIQKLSDVSG